MLKFIGTGSAFNTELGNTSAYVKSNETLLLIDCGESVFARIKKINLLEDVKNVYIIITHLHSDHVASLATLIEYLNIFKGIVPNIILTNEDSNEAQEQAISSFLSLQGIEEGEYEFTYADMLEGVITDLVKVELIEVKHFERLTSYAIELYFKDKTIYYTGDIIDKSYLKSVAKKLNANDMVYTDCTNKEYKGRVHISIKELQDIFDEKKRAQVTTMHFDSFQCINEAKDAGFMVAKREESLEDILNSIKDRK